MEGWGQWGCDVNTGTLVWRFLYSSVVLHVQRKKTVVDENMNEIIELRMKQLKNREIARPAFLY